METLIKSPPISERGVDLPPQPRMENRFPSAAPQEPRTPEAPRDEPAHAAPSRNGKPSESTTQSSHDAAPSLRSPQPQVPESRIKEQLAVQQAALKEAEAKAVAEGFAKGLAEGKQTGEEKYSAALVALSTLVENGQDSVSGLLRDAEQVIGAIVFEAVCKIVGKELANSEGCSAVVQQVLAKAIQEEIVSVRVSPKDCQTLRAGLPVLPVESDDRVELGGCILALKGGSIDGRIETQFRAFAQSLKDALRER